MSTQKVVTRKKNGEIKTNEMDSKVVEDSKKNWIDSVVKVDNIQFDTCKIHYANRFNNRVNDIVELFDFGLLFQQAKRSVNNNNKAFGKWREKHFPMLTNQFVSYSINLIVHKDDIEDWIETTEAETVNREYRNPYSVYVAFNRYKKKIADKALEAMVTKVPEVPNVDEVVKGIGTDTDTDIREISIAEPVEKTGIPIERSELSKEEKVQHWLFTTNALITLYNEEKVSKVLHADIKKLASNFFKLVDNYKPKK